MSITHSPKNSYYNQIFLGISILRYSPQLYVDRLEVHRIITYYLNPGEFLKSNYKYSPLIVCSFQCVAVVGVASLMLGSTTLKF